jgi:hypothetical protein
MLINWRINCFQFVTNYDILSMCGISSVGYYYTLIYAHVYSIADSATREMGEGLATDFGALPMTLV